MGREAEVLDKLRGIIDPDLGRDIVSLGFVKDLRISDDGMVSLLLELTTPACPLKSRFKEAAEKGIAGLPWVKAVSVRLTARAPNAAAQRRAPGLAGVRHIVAVYSCKGGVGKSTVAVNLAGALRLSGARVGLLDADIYGPSLTTLLHPDSTRLATADGMIQPVDYEGMPVLSFAFVTPPDGRGPAIMRGPMVSQLITQLLNQTNWGTLDYLIIDLPPGTGDIPLTILQQANLAGAVMVTTPQQLSFIDVVKGIHMFSKLKVPILAVVENMSFFVCPHCGRRSNVFGSGARQRLVNEFGIKNSFEIPLDPRISELSDLGRPITFDPAESQLSTYYREIADAVVREISKLEFGGFSPPEVIYDENRGIVVRSGGEEHIVPARDLRLRCRCADCVDEHTGAPLLQPEKVPPDIHPVVIKPVGNYAVSIQWSDGHYSIYPYETLLAEE